MASNDPNLRVRISADINDIKQGLALVRQEVSKFRTEAAKAIDLSGVTEGFNNLRNLVGGLFAGVTVGSLFSAMIAETREASGELAQLQAVLKSTGQQAGYSQQQLLDMADGMAAATTHSAGEIVKAQTRLLSYTGIVGKQFPLALQMAIDQSARLGESIEQSAETVGKALDKPSQGVAALTKQGFKFTEQQKQQMKVLEASGRTAEAQQIVLESMGESYAGAAAAARNTFGGALTAVGNALRDLMDGSGGSGMAGVTRAINDLASALASPEIKSAFAEMADSVMRALTAFTRFIAQDGVKFLRRLAEGAAFTVRHIDQLAVALGTYLAVQGIGAAITGVTALIRWLAALRAAILATELSAKGLRAAFATMGGPITLVIAGLTTALYSLYQRTDEAREAAEAHTEAIRANKEMSKLSREESLKDARSKREQAMASLAAAKAELAAATVKQQIAPGSRAGGNLLGLQESSQASVNTGVFKAQAAIAQAQKEIDDWDARIFETLTTGIEEMLKPVEEAADAGATAIAKSNANLIDAVRRSLAELDRLYQDSGISIEQYFAKRTALQQKSIDLELDQARAELAIAADAAGRRRIEEQIVKLQRDRAEVATGAADEQRKAEQALSQSLSEVRGRLLELDGNTGTAERQQLEAQYKGLLERLRAEGDATGQALVASLIDRLVAKAKSDELRQALSRITAELQSTETSLGAQVSAGMLGYGEGERQIAEARAKALADMRQLRVASVEAMAALAKGSPEHASAVEGLQELDANIAQVIQSQNVWAQRIEDTAASSLGDFLADLSTGAKSFKTAFADMVRNFVAGVARMLAQEAALRTVQSLFNMGGIGGAGGSNVKSGVPVNKHHTGGRVGGGGGTRMHLPISPLVFGNAPRFHSGGGFGLRSDERAAILQTGERVLSRQQTAAYDAGRNGPSRLRVEIDNRGAPAKVEDASMGKGADGDGIIRLVLSAVADDVANGGMVGQAGVARYGWRETL